MVRLAQPVVREGPNSTMGGPSLPMNLSFANALTIDGRPLPPHPGPLPWGEGESHSDLKLANRFWFVRRRAMQFPLPKGEGQGEGEQDVSQRDAQNGLIQGFKARDC